MSRLAFQIPLILLIIWIGRIFNSGIEESGYAFVMFWFALAIGLRSKAELKAFSFPVSILGVVALAMFFPQYFQEVKGFKLTQLINPLIQLIMFGMGATLSWKDFAAVAKSPKSVGIGVFAQLTIMPLVGFGLAQFSGLEPEVAAGLILVGCSPSGTASNVMAFLARANVALSVTLTSITTLMAPLMTPVLMKLLAGQFIEIDLLKMMWDIFKIILLPVGAGLLVNQFLGGKSTFIEKLLPLVSMLGIALIILVITAAGRDSLLDIGPILIVLVLVHNLLGYGIGYGFSKLIGMKEQDARTIAIEVGMQNAGLASGLSQSLGKLVTVGLAPAVFGPMQNVTGSILATFWSKKGFK
ncbi:BASS family bile acid:Na+ symporter [Algoriphagus boseongensis]|uniref:BASS family bile acid:Na+ symporter n=1 Tax=Algoriphagus boseongensis TaxID=1442587 RepID=A0A4R6T669_9BACT|nr:bile acid:sodium symporter family protein [Algoriphagus boseongensis]TDQ15256.1 BASS family bile acid:Na+ symporter [Algoriphagus boseongensis]